MLRFPGAYRVVPPKFVWGKLYQDLVGWQEAPRRRSSVIGAKTNHRYSNRSYRWQIFMMVFISIFVCFVFQVWEKPRVSFSGKHKVRERPRYWMLGIQGRAFRASFWFLAGKSSAPSQFGVVWFQLGRWALLPPKERHKCRFDLLHLLHVDSPLVLCLCHGVRSYTVYVIYKRTNMCNFRA